LPWVQPLKPHLCGNTAAKNNTPPDGRSYISAAQRNIRNIWYTFYDCVSRIAVGMRGSSRQLQTSSLDSRLERDLERGEDRKTASERMKRRHSN